jgi:[ribosomal protein S5]-alanine N-acetyltransferase
MGAFCMYVQGRKLGASMPTESSQFAHQSSSRRSPDDLRSTGTSSDPYPRLRTRGFRFRPFSPADIAPFAALAGEHRIADTTIGVPHPYTAELARMWIFSHSTAWAARQAVHWAALRIGEDRIVGYAGLHNIDMQRRQAELRFWVGCGVQRQENGTEWSEAVVEFALMVLALNRVYALQLERHPLAGHVLSAIGMKQEGLLRKRAHKDGLVEDMVCWVILRGDWQPRFGRQS